MSSYCSIIKHGRHTMDPDDNMMHRNNSAPNNLSIVSDSDDEGREVIHKIESVSKNIPTAPVGAPHSMMKFSSDSGRSSLREERSPYLKRVPFKSFMHQKAVSIDDSGNHSQDEEISIASFHRRRGLHTHGSTLSAECTRADISNVRATEGSPMKHVAGLSHSSINNSDYIAEVPKGFRSSTSSRSRASPHSTTSDYESNTPTPEITSSSMLDYCADLPSQTHISKSMMSRTNSYSDNETYGGSKHSSEPYYNKVN